MSHNRMYPFFSAPSPGDRLLTAATSAKVELHRFSPATRAELLDSAACAADGNDEPICEVSFELRGSLPVSGNAAAGLVRDLLREFRTPQKPRQPHDDAGAEGGASC